MRLLGVDPGKNSGYAILDTDYMDEQPLDVMNMEIHEDTPFQCAQRVDDLHMRGEVDFIVVERFVPRFGQAFDCTPMYLIGALQGQYDEEINLVMPATHKGSVPRAKTKALMKAQGFKIGAGHSLDALSLCLYWAGFKLREPNVLAFLAEEV